MTHLYSVFQQIRIRDPNQGGRDITEEIMSGGRSGSTPTPPQVSYNTMMMDTSGLRWSSDQTSGSSGPNYSIKFLRKLNLFRRIFFLLKALWNYLSRGMLKFVCVKFLPMCCVLPETFMITDS